MGQCGALTVSPILGEAPFFIQVYPSIQFQAECYPPARLGLRCQDRCEWSQPFSGTAGAGRWHG